MNATERAAQEAVAAYKAELAEKTMNYHLGCPEGRREYLQWAGVLEKPRELKQRIPVSVVVEFEVDTSIFNDSNDLDPVDFVTEVQQRVQHALDSSALVFSASTWVQEVSIIHKVNEMDVDVEDWEDDSDAEDWAELLYETS